MVPILGCLDSRRVEGKKKGRLHADMRGIKK